MSLIKKCAICHSPVSDLSKAHQSELYFSLVCHNCHKRFSKEDIELMLSLFFAYGGYFGKKKKSKFLIVDFVSKFAKKYAINGNFSVEDLNSQILHKLLLYGVTPGEYVEKLSEFFK